MTTASLQFEHHFRQTLVRDFVLELLLVSLGDLVVLTIDATKVAVAEEDVARALAADERWFLTEVRGVRRDDRQSARVTGGDLVVQAVVKARSEEHTSELQSLAYLVCR